MMQRKGLPVADLRARQDIAYRVSGCLRRLRRKGVVERHEFRAGGAVVAADAWNVYLLYSRKEGEWVDFSLLPPDC